MVVLLVKYMFAVDGGGFSFLCFFVFAGDGMAVSSFAHFFFVVLLLICLLCLFPQLPNSLFMLPLLGQQQCRTSPVLRVYVVLAKQLCWPRN